MDDNTYVHILVSTLSKKNNLLDNLITVTLLQEGYINTESFDMEQFEQTLPEKEVMIEQLNLLDEGFEQVYDHVKSQLNNYTNQFEQEILQLQELIRQVTEKSVRLQALEMQNKNKLESYFTIKKKEVKDFKMSRQMANNYYKNTANQHSGESYFLDKKN